MSELITLNIVIGDRQYRIKAATTDEETVRSTVKLINDKIIEFKTNFAGKDMQDYIAMVIIWWATEMQNKNTPILQQELLAEVLKLEQKIDDVL
jgi:cell division protein ZapA (FtsZ GTPase activity inhibitor)